MRCTQSRVVRNCSIVKLFVGIPLEWNGKVLKRPGLDGRNVIVGYKRCRGTGNGQEEDFRRVDGRRKGDAEASRREADAAELQGGGDAASGSRLQVYSRDPEEDAVFAGGVCPKAANQRKNFGEMGAGASQAESTGGCAGSASAAISGHTGAAGKGSGRLMR